MGKCIQFPQNLQKDLKGKVTGTMYEETFTIELIDLFTNIMAFFSFQGALMALLFPQTLPFRRYVRDHSEKRRLRQILQYE